MNSPAVVNSYLFQAQSLSLSRRHGIMQLFSVSKFRFSIPLFLLPSSHASLPPLVSFKKKKYPNPKCGGLTVFKCLRFAGYMLFLVTLEVYIRCIFLQKSNHSSCFIALLLCCFLDLHQCISNIFHTARVFTLTFVIH